MNGAKCIVEDQFQTVSAKHHSRTDVLALSEHKNKPFFAFTKKTHVSFTF